MALKLLLLCGGRSEEHDVSLNSARSFIDAVDKDILLDPIVIDKSGKLLSKEDSLARLEQNQPESNKKPRPINQLSLNKYDLVFPLLHGPYGEDGSMQGFLKLNSAKFVGSDVLASAASMDKIIMKTIFGAIGIPQVDYIAISRHNWQTIPEVILESLEKFSFPLFIKPANLGSSIGISRANDFQELRTAIDLAAKYDRRIIVEQGLSGARELEIAVLGNDEPRVSVVGEIVFDSDIYDYETKYTANQAKLQIPADIPKYVAKQCEELALRAYKIIDAAGLARIDFFFDEVKNKVYLNEINTLPGFTQTSMYPKLWQASGLSYSELINELISLALENR